MPVELHSALESLAWVLSREECEECYDEHYAWWETDEEEDL